MTKQTLAIAVAIIAVCALAIFLLVQKESETTSHQKLFAAFTTDALHGVNQIQAIVLERGAQVVRIRRDAQGIWRVASNNDFPADVTVIRELLRALIEAETIEQKSSRPQDYPKLGLADPEASAGAGILVRLFTGDSQWKIIFGNTPQHLGQGQYIRLPEKDESWLINRRIDLDLDTNRWLDRRIIHIEPEHLHKIEVQHNKKDSLVVVRAQKGGNLELSNLSEDSELRSDFILQQLAAAVDYLNFKEVFARDDSFVLPKKHLRATFTTFDGLKFTIQAYQLDEDAYAVAEIDYDEEVAEQFSVEQAIREEILLQKELMSPIYANWYYKLLTPTYDALDVQYDDLTVNKEKSE